MIILSNLIGFAMLAIIVICCFKSGRKFLAKLLKNLVGYLKKIAINLLKNAALKACKLFVNTLKELKFVKEIWQNKKERYMYIACTVISLTLMFYKYGINYILFLSLLTYFVFRAMTREFREARQKKKIEKVSKKYEGISKMFNDQVKVVEVKDGIYKLNSFVPENAIIRKQDEIEHFLNREIVSIKRDQNNFKLIKISTKTEETKRKNVLNKIYIFEDYILNIKRDSSEIFFTTGIDKNGNILTFDLVKLTHTFIAGMQGGGKSNLLNVIIQSMMYFNNNIFYIMTDFKSVELGQYENFKNTIFIEDLNDFLEKLTKLELEMNIRYQKLKKEGVKKISQYNKKTGENIPYIVGVFDEMSDIGLCNDKTLKDNIEEVLTRIMNKGRAAGILIIGATQRPAASQVNTNIRDRFGTKFSARIKDKRTQEMAGIKGTENLKDGQFMMEYIEEIQKFKAFYIDELESNKVYENLHKKLLGGVNLDKII